MAVNETFSAFSKHSSVTAGWPDPPEDDSTGFPDDEYYFVDSIGADNGSQTWIPDPKFTRSSPPYDYNTKLKYADQKWFIGTTTNGSGYQFFNGDVEHYQDHGVSKE